MSFKNTFLPVATSLQSKGNLLDLSQPVVMGILNGTPDSFYSGSRVSRDKVLAVAEGMIADGAAILDIGAYSTRPGAAPVSEQEELDRLLPIIETINTTLPDAWISADTYRAAVARAAVAAGARIINDISGGNFEPHMLQTVAALKVPYIAMHLQGNPDTMHQSYTYEDIALAVLDDLCTLAARCREAGITDLILDPGFGFSKAGKQNFELLNRMAALRAVGRPLIAGISRKSMIWRTLDTTPEGALNGTTALHVVALQQGASILRVHDVKDAVEVVRLFAQF